MDHQCDRQTDEQTDRRTELRQHSIKKEKSGSISTKVHEKEPVADPGLANGGPRSSAAGASVEALKAPREVGCGEGVSPYPLARGLGRGQYPLLRKFFDCRSKNVDF